MSVKVIIEFKTKPGKRATLLNLMKTIGEKFGPILRERGGHGFALYEAHDDADVVVEVAEWDSVDARETLMKEATASGDFAPMMELLAGPPKSTYLKPVV